MHKIAVFDHSEKMDSPVTQFVRLDRIYLLLSFGPRTAAHYSLVISFEAFLHLLGSLGFWGLREVAVNLVGNVIISAVSIFAVSILFMDLCFLHF